MEEEPPPVRLFVPPDTVVHRQPEPLPVQVLPTPAVDSAALVVGVAAVDRSGRVREQLLVSALGWRGGDRINTYVQPDMIILRQESDGPFRIDTRQQVFLPAGNRAVFKIGTGDRVVLVAMPERGLLIVHPIGIITGLLATYYASRPGDLGAY